VSKLKIQWLGGPSFILEMGSFRFLNDPVFGEGDSAFTMPADPGSAAAGKAVKRLVPLPECDVEELDGVIITRTGDDHFDLAAAERLDVGLRVITPQDDPERLIEHGFTDMEALEWGQSFTDEKNGETITVTATPTSFAEGRVSNGYVVSHRSGEARQTIYWTGDTRWFKDARPIKELSDRFDVIVPYLGAVGGNNTLDGKEAMQFVFLVQAKRIVPVNYKTFSHYTEGIDDFKERVGLTMYEKKLVVLDEGGTFER
jgi:L-ascorbate metabolism protein UlaG (beta-lactamase superfamily)